MQGIISMAVALAATEQGSGPPLLILHGLFGSGRNWAAIAKPLADMHRVFLLDLRNHGASPWADSMRYPEMAADVLAFIRARKLGPVALMGHSMGGKAAMLAALVEPRAIERLVVVDVAPVAREPALLAYVRAMAAVDLSRVTRRNEVDPLLASAVPSAAERGFLLQNLVIEDGKARWRINLEAIDSAMPDIAGWPDNLPASSYPGPSLFIAGAKSDYIRPQDEPAIRRLFPRAEIVRIPGAGHWVHAEAPEAFLVAVQPFLSAVSGG
jgi:esterase